MQDNEVWNLVPLLEGSKPIGCNVERYKTHLVAKGFT